MGHRLIDLYAANVEAVHAAAVSQGFSRTMVTGRGVATLVVRTQPAPTVPAGGDALQQRGAFSHSATGLMWRRPRVAGDALKIGFVGWPVNIPGMVLWDEHGPLGAG